MITGSIERKIRRYLLIDHVGEGYSWVFPDVEEELVGIPYGFCTDDSWPFIEHRQGVKVIRTVNALDVSEIEFLD